MKIEQSEIKDLTAVITMTVEPADYQEAVQKELIQIRKKANIPGFRPGMAPKSMLQKMYGKSILAEVINRLSAKASTSTSRSTTSTFSAIHCQTRSSLQR